MPTPLAGTTPVGVLADTPFRLVVAGSVDHGKSTLIGRLLADTNSLPEGRIERLRASCAAAGRPFEWAFVLDALAEEQAQNVTLDTTRAAFATARRRYELIDAPGHEAFLDRMVTGAAAADAALLVVSAPDGLVEQTRRHAHTLGLLGVRPLVVALNKFDRVEEPAARFAVLAAELRDLARDAGLVLSATVPLAARDGLNLARPHAFWAEAAPGPSLLEALEALPAGPPPSAGPLRFVVQDVYREPDRRVVVGRVESGVLRVGDPLLFLPGGSRARVQALLAWPEPGPSAVAAPAPAALLLEPETYVERGMVATPPDDPPAEGDRLRLRVLGLAAEPLEAGGMIDLCLGPAESAAEVVRIDRAASAAGGAGRELAAGDFAEVELRPRRALAFEPFARVAALGRATLRRAGAIVAVGAVLESGAPRRRPGAPTKGTWLSWSEGRVTAAERRRRRGHPGLVVWFTGLSGAGKSTLAAETERALFDLGRDCFLLDGDNVRHGLCRDLGFSAADRSENVRRVAEAARLFADAGLICLTALISPFRADRAHARSLLPDGRFFEVHVATPLATCRARDPKGLYAKAEAGIIAEFTGVSSPYEPPEAPELVIDTTDRSVRESAAAVLEGLLPHLRRVD